MEKNKGKIVLVTGASSGIGKATAKLLVNSGYTVYGAARRIDRMEDIRTMGCYIHYLDVTDDNSMVSVVNDIVSKEGRIDILVNNAGFGFYGTVEDVPIYDAKMQMEVNLFGLSRMCQLVLPYMRQQKSGTIVNISSIAGKMSTPLGGWYHASKYAVEGLSDALRNEVKEFGIDVILIEPGIINTPWWIIARKNMESISGKSAYRKLLDNSGKILDISGGSSQPEVIAETIHKAVEQKNPKARYSKGYHSGVILFAKKWLPDSLYDKVIRKFLKID